MFSKLLIAPLSLGLLTGCTQLYPVSLSADPGMGEAVKYDIAVQTIDPDPVYGPDSAQPGDNGEHGQKAVDRYRKGSVKEVQQMSSRSSGGGGGGSGGGPN
jgi:hypothetical protein